MNEPFGDTPLLPGMTWTHAEVQRGRVLALAREMMLATMANPDIDEFHFGNLVRMAEAWIADEDAYVLPEEMQ